MDGTIKSHYTRSDFIGGCEMARKKALWSGLAACCLVYACGDPATLQEVSGEFRKVHFTGSDIVVDLAIKNLWDDASVIGFSAMEYEKAAKWLSRNRDRPGYADADTLTVIVHVPLLDAYGNSTMSRVLTYRIDLATVAKINWDNAGYHTLLNLSDVDTETPVALDALIKWCGKSGNAKWAPRLCRRR